MDHRQIVDEAEAYAEAGVGHVVAAPWRRTAEEWIDSMETLVELVPIERYCRPISAASSALRASASCRLISWNSIV